MKPKLILVAWALLAGTTGIAANAWAQNYPNQANDPAIHHDRGTSPDDRHRSDDGMRRDDQRHRDDGARSGGRDDHGRYDGRGWGRSRHCRSVWYHHRMVRKCW